MSDPVETIKFKVVKQSPEGKEPVIVEVEKGSVTYERISKIPSEYLPLSPIEKEPDKTSIIDADAAKKEKGVKK
jgi:hypothetical protein